MQRRTLLLFTLFVVTAWFYSSLTQSSTDNAIREHQKQVQMMNQVDEVLSAAQGTSKDKDQG